MGGVDAWQRQCMAHCVFGGLTSLSPSLFVTTSLFGKLVRFVTISLADLKLESGVIVRDGMFVADRPMISYYKVRENQVCCI